MAGFPNNTAEAQARVESSHLLMRRTVSVLHAVYQSGGHACLEQPRNSIVWAEPVVQSFLLDIAADLIQVPACKFGLNLKKHWVLATSWRPLQQLQGVCEHEAGFHPSFHGKRDADGTFLSRNTSVFPAQMCALYMRAIAPLFSGLPSDAVASHVSWHEALASLPPRPVDDFPVAQQDGGGIYSCPDWTSPPPGVSDVFRDMRNELMQFFATHGVFDRLRKHVAESSRQPLFNEAEVSAMRGFWESWFRSQGFSEEISWRVPEDQPYCLFALEKLSQALHDRSVRRCMIGIPPCGLICRLVFLLALRVTYPSAIVSFRALRTSTLHRLMCRSAPAIGRVLMRTPNCWMQWSSRSMKPVIFINVNPWPRLRLGGHGLPWEK